MGEQFAFVFKKGGKKLLAEKSLVFTPFFALFCHILKNPFFVKRKNKVFYTPFFAVLCNSCNFDIRFRSPIFVRNIYSFLKTS
jgi:hypothetical protein